MIHIPPVGDCDVSRVDKLFEEWVRCRGEEGSVCKMLYYQEETHGKFRGHFQRISVSRLTKNWASPRKVVFAKAFENLF